MTIEIWAVQNEFGEMPSGEEGSLPLDGGEARLMGEAADWDDALDKIEGWASSDDSDDPGAWPSPWDAFGYDRESGLLQWYTDKWESAEGVLDARLLVRSEEELR